MDGKTWIMDRKKEGKADFPFLLPVPCSMFPPSALFLGRRPYLSLPFSLLSRAIIADHGKFCQSSGWHLQPPQKREFRSGFKTVNRVSGHGGTWRSTVGIQFVLWKFDLVGFTKKCTIMNHMRRKNNSRRWFCLIAAEAPISITHRYIVASYIIWNAPWRNGTRFAYP